MCLRFQPNQLAVFFTDRDDNLRNLDRYNTNIERSYFRAVETLRKVQNDWFREERRNAFPVEKIGFVSQSKPAAAKTSKSDVPDMPYTDYPIVDPEDRDPSYQPKTDPRYPTREKPSHDSNGAPPGRPIKKGGYHRME